jgi:uncharacterized protein (TIGR01244 family)
MERRAVTQNRHNFSAVPAVPFSGKSRTNRTSGAHMLNRHSIAAALAAMLLGTSGVGAQKLVNQEAIKSVPAPVILDNAGMFQDKYARVGDDFFVAGQPTEKALREMKAQGVTTIVNLRSPSEMERIGFDESKLIADLGMKYVYLPVRGDAQFPYTPETLAKFTETMRSAEGKVLLHCTVAWRASHLWGAYLIQQGVPVADALTHARAINLMDDHRMDASGREPIELFLGKKVTGVGKP